VCSVAQGAAAGPGGAHLRLSALSAMRVSHAATRPVRCDTRRAAPRQLRRLRQNQRTPPPPQSRTTTCQKGSRGAARRASWPELHCADAFGWEAWGLTGVRVRCGCVCTTARGAVRGVRIAARHDRRRRPRGGSGSTTRVTAAPRRRRLLVLVLLFRRRRRRHACPTSAHQRRRCASGREPQRAALRRGVRRVRRVSHRGQPLPLQRVPSRDGLRPVRGVPPPASS